MMKVALELQPCCWRRSGIGTYAYELATRSYNTASMEFCGNVFNFCGRTDNRQALKGIQMPVHSNRLLSYGIYRRIWHWVPIPYQAFFPNDADLSVFFNFIVPPRVRGRVITTIHDLTYIKYPETMQKSNLRHLSRGMARSIERSDRIIAVSKFTKWEIHEQFGIPLEKISVVYNAPSLSTEIADSAATKQKHRIHMPYILFVGNIEPRKNIVRLLKAFEHLKQRENIPHQLVLAGGKGWRDEEILKTTSALSCREDVIFTGYISGAEKNLLYRDASLFVFPSIYEGFGIPPLEAMKWNCPVVCANAASIPEVVGDAACLVDPFSIESIAEGMGKVLFDQKYAEHLRQAGAQRAQAFSWESSAQCFRRVLEQALQD